MSHLSSNKHIRFDNTRQLLRTDTPTNTIYALHKLTGNLPRRNKRQAQQALGAVFKKRKLRSPQINKPVYVQPLLHSTFPQDLRYYLKSQLTKHHNTLLPLHIPSTKLVCKKHPPVQPAQLASSTHNLGSTESPDMHVCFTTAQHFSATYTQATCRNTARAASTRTSVSCLLRQKQRTHEDTQLATQLTKSICSWHKHHHVPTTHHDIKQFVTQQIQKRRASKKQHISIHATCTSPRHTHNHIDISSFLPTYSWGLKRLGSHPSSLHSIHVPTELHQRQTHRYLSQHHGQAIAGGPC